MKEIDLGCGLKALVDEIDYEHLSKHRWYAKPICRKDGGWYAFRTDQENGPKTIYMHRYLLSADASQQVDHANRDGLDNRRANLRICTQSLNNANRASADNLHGYRGIIFLAGRKKPYRGCVWVKKKTIRTPYYSSIEEAAKARDELAKEYYGDFAVLNFPEGSS